MRWTLDVEKKKCACGTMAQYATSTDGRYRRVFEHRRPDGGPCPEWEWQDGVERTRAICEAAGVPLPAVYEPEVAR